MSAKGVDGEIFSPGLVWVTRETPDIKTDSLSLGPYEELRGRLESLVQNDRSLYIYLSSGTLRFESESMAADICTDVLEGREGASVSILRTASPEAPVIVEVDESDGGDISSEALQTMRSVEEIYRRIDLHS